MLATFTTPQRPSDLLVALVYGICLEMGFVPADKINASDGTKHPTIRTFWGYSYVDSIVSTFAAVPANLIEIQQQMWPQETGQSPHSNGRTYKFTLQLLNFSERLCRLVARNIFNSDAICITFSNGNGTGQSVVLPVKRYVRFDGAVERPMAINQLNDPANTLTNIKELAHKIKSSIIIPIRNGVMNEGGYLFGGLDGMPRDVLWLLFERFDLQSLQNISRVCLRLRSEVVAFIEATGRQIRPIERRRIQMVPYQESPLRLPSNMPYYYYRS